MKKNALSHLQLLRAREDCRQIDALGDEYEKRFGRRPANIAELVQRGFLRGVPADPVGVPYAIGADGRAQLSESSPLLEKKKIFDRSK